jgi:hypothetical protein
MARKRESIKQRILRTIDKKDGCWIWTGCATRDGYGVLTVGRKQFRAHRLSYEEFVCPIGDGKLVCHSCDTPLCVNPKHLFLGSPRDNTQDMIKKGRKAIVRDANHPHTKISHAQRAEVRKKRASGMRLKEIAEQYGVSFQTISNICLRRRSYV